VASGAGAAFLAGGTPFFPATGADGLERFSSLELQLEIPKAANNESTTTVKAIRAGVHNGFTTLVLFFADIS